MIILDLRKIDNFFLLVGFCVIEGEEMVFWIVDCIVKIIDKLGIFYVFKGFYCKVNCFCLDLFIGIGDEKVLKVFCKVWEIFGIFVVIDIYSVGEVVMVVEYVDVL